MRDPNARIVHADCAPKPNPVYAATLPEMFVGAWVKVAIETRGLAGSRIKEHAWWMVEKVLPSGRLLGRLDTELVGLPVGLTFTPGSGDGYSMAIDRSHISAVQEPDE